LNELEARGRDLLEAHRGDLDALAASLEEHETLEADAIRDLLGDAKEGAAKPHGGKSNAGKSGDDKKGDDKKGDSQDDDDNSA